MAMEITGRVGPDVLQDGVRSTPRLERSGALVMQQLHGQYYEQALRGNLYWAANQSATAWSVALATTYTGLVLSNPIGSGVNAVILQAGFALSAAPAAISSIGFIGGYATTGLTAHTTPLTPLSAMLNQDQSTGKIKVDAAATLVGTPRWVMPFMGGFTAAALPSTSPSVIDLRGSVIVPPGGYFGIGALTAVTGFGGILYEEVPV